MQTRVEGAVKRLAELREQLAAVEADMAKVAKGKVEGALAEKFSALTEKAAGLREALRDAETEHARSRQKAEVDTEYEALKRAHAERCAKYETCNKELAKTIAEVEEALGPFYRGGARGVRQMGLTRNTIPVMDAIVRLNMAHFTMQDSRKQLNAWAREHELL